MFFNKGNLIRCTDPEQRLSLSEKQNVFNLFYAVFLSLDHEQKSDFILRSCSFFPVVGNLDLLWRGELTLNSLVCQALTISICLETLNISLKSNTKILTILY